MYTRNTIHILFAALAALLSGCHFNSSRENASGDKADAMLVTGKFYELMKNNRAEEATKLFSKKVLESENGSKLTHVFSKTLSECGEIIGDSLIACQSMVVEGTDPRSEYLMAYYVKRSIRPTTETFSMTKENDSIKIVGYKVNMDLMGEP